MGRDEQEGVSLAAGLSFKGRETCWDWPLRWTGQGLGQ